MVYKHKTQPFNVNKYIWCQEMPPLTVMVKKNDKLEQNENYQPKTSVLDLWTNTLNVYLIYVFIYMLAQYMVTFRNPGLWIVCIVSEV